MQKDKYDFPTTPGEKSFYAAEIYPEKALRTAATMRGTRHAHWLRVSRVAGGCEVECTDGPTPRKRKREKRIEELKLPKELKDTLRTLTLLVIDLKNQVEELNEKLNR